MANKLCSVCQEKDAIPKRTICHGCKSRRRRAAARGTASAAILPERPTAPNPPAPQEPLAAAYARYEDRIIARDAAARERALVEENKALRAQIEQLVPMRKAPSIHVYDRAASERYDAIACAILSDWHVEEMVQSSDVHGLNEYAPEIAKARAALCFQNLLKLTDISARDSKITTIHIDLDGDFFSGHIHEELMASTAMAPGEAALFAKELICSGLDFLLRESTYALQIDCVPGNHGRMTKQVWISDPTGTSLETFMYHMIAERYRDNARVNINVADRAMVYREFFPNFTTRLIHGYEINYGGGIGGITIPVRKAIGQWNIAKNVQLTKLGHFHQRLDGGDHLVNGSLIGMTQYSQFVKAAFERPQQAFYVINARNGGTKGIVAPIWVTPDETPAT